MIRLTVGSTTDRKTVIVNPDTTLRDALEDNEVDYSTASVLLDGANVKPGDLDRTFAELGTGEKAMLMAITKTNNA